MAFRLSKDHTTFVELLARRRLPDRPDRQIPPAKLHRTARHQQVRTGRGHDAPSPHLRDAKRTTATQPTMILRLSRNGTARFKTALMVISTASNMSKSPPIMRTRLGRLSVVGAEQRADFDDLVGPENALPDNRIDAPQAWRTAVPEELYSTNWIADRSEAWLTERATDDDPFFLQMSFPDPHHPFTPPGKYWDMYDPATSNFPPPSAKATCPRSEPCKRRWKTAPTPATTKPLCGYRGRGAVHHRPDLRHDHDDRRRHWPRAEAA